jgi:hypothetical protein
MKVLRAKRGDQVDRLQVSRALDIQVNLQWLAADIRCTDADAAAPGMFGYAQLQARVVELMALLGLVWQLTAAAEQAVLAVGNGLTALQVSKTDAGITQVVEVGLGERKHPLRRRDAPVIPAFAPAVVAWDSAVNHGPG